MAQQKFNAFERRAIWEAHNKKCGHCREPLSFASLEIDHIIPEYLKNAEDSKWIEVCETYGLDSEFDLFSFENLIASCYRCNSQKQGKLLSPGITAIQLAISAKEKTTVKTLIAKFKKDDKVDKLRFGIAAAIESGTLSVDKIPKLLSEIQNKEGNFKLSTPFPIFGEASLVELSREKYEEYLDTALVLPDWFKEGLRLVKDEGDELYVRTLREYQNATENGFYPLSNAEMKSAYTYFVRPLEVLKILSKAKISERSYLDDPRKGLPDISILPATLLFSMNSAAESNLLNRENVTIGDLVERREAVIVQVASDILSIEYQEQWTVMFELMRADVNGDGIQELIINWGGGPLRGTLFVGDVKVLARPNSEAIFSVIEYREPAI